MIGDHMQTASSWINVLHRFSSTDRGLAAAFLVAAILAGYLSFSFADGVRELFSAPPYQPSLPVPSDVARDIARVFAAAPPLPSSENVVATTDRGNWIRIPALSLNFPLATAATMNGEDILRALQVGIVRYPNGVHPGDPGIVMIAGHSTGEPWKGRYRFAFMQARKLQPGDRIHLDYSGTRYTYQVTGQRMINPRETPFLDSAADHPKLSIISCWPLWTTKERLVVDAALSESARLVVRPVLPEG